MAITLGSQAATQGVDFSTTVSGAAGTPTLVNGADGVFSFDGTKLTARGDRLTPGTLKVAFDDFTMVNGVPAHAPAAFDITVARAGAVAPVSITVPATTPGGTVSVTPAATNLPSGTVFQLLDARGGNPIDPAKLGVTFDKSTGALSGTLAAGAGLFDVVIVGMKGATEVARSRRFSAYNDPTYVPSVISGGGGGGGGGPALTLSATSPSIASNAAAGTLVSNISNVPAGVTPTVASDGGVLVRAGDATNGWKVVVGMATLVAGTVNFSVAATGATRASGVLTVTSAAGALVNPLVAYLGPSTTAQGLSTTSGRRKTNIGPQNYTRSLFPAYRFPIWLGDTGPGTGLLYANDGGNFGDYSYYAPFIAVSDAQVLIFEPGRNNLGNYSGNTAGWLAECLRIINIVRSGNPSIKIGIRELWYPTFDVATFEADSQNRYLIESINAAFPAWCAANDITLIRTCEFMCTGTTRNSQPLPGYVRGDGRHLTAAGGWPIALRDEAFLRSIIAPATPYDAASTSNLVTNSAFTGTGGTMSANVSGQVPDGYRVSLNTLEGGTIATAQSSIVSVNGRNRLRLVIDTSAETSFDGASFSLDGPSVNLTISKWYRMRARFAKDTNYPKFSIISAAVGHDSLTFADGLAVLNSGTPTTQTTASGQPIPLAYAGGELETPVFKATAATASIRLKVGATPAPGTGTVEFYDLDVQEVLDPNLYQGAVATLPDNTINVVEGGTFDIDLTFSKPGVLAKVSGSAAFTVLDNDTVRFVAPAYNSAAPSANSYSAVFRLTSPGGQTVDVTLVRGVVSASAFRTIAIQGFSSSTGNAAAPAEPAGVQNGDVALDCIVFRDTAPFVVPDGFTPIQQLAEGNTSSGSSGSKASALMAFRARTAAMGGEVYTRTGGLGGRAIRIWLRQVAPSAPLDASAGSYMAGSGTAVSVPGVTTTVANDLLVAMAFCGRTGTISGIAATDPSERVASSPAGSNPVDPAANIWTQIYSLSTSGDSGHAFSVSVAVKPQPGPTGNIVATLGASNVGGAIVAAFKRNG